MKAENAALRTRSRNGAAATAFAGFFARMRAPTRSRAPLVDFAIRCGRDLSTKNPSHRHHQAPKVNRVGTARYPLRARSVKEIGRDHLRSAPHGHLERAAPVEKNQAGSRPLALRTRFASGVERKSITARPACAWCALAGMPATKGVTIWISGGSGPTTSMPETAISSAIC